MPLAPGGDGQPGRGGHLTTAQLHSEPSLGSRPCSLLGTWSSQFPTCFCSLSPLSLTRFIFAATGLAASRCWQ